MKPDRLNQLLDAYFDQVLTPQEREELEYLLLSSPPARREFWRRARFQALLRRFGTENWGKWLTAHTAFARAESVGRLARWRRQLADALAAPWPELVLRWSPAALALIFAGLILFWRSTPVAAPSEAELAAGTNAFPDGVAELVQTVNVEWKDGSPHWEAGSVLAPGWIEFKRGLVELQFYRGARVVIQGPAKLQLVSDMEASCQLGRLRVEVPPSAHGFKIQTPRAQVVDLGTAFAMQVVADGQAEVHVLQGKIQMADASGTKTVRELTQGQSVQVGQTGEIRDIHSPLGSFPTSSEVERRASAEKRRHYEAWQKYSQQLTRDPGLLAYYNFETTDTHVLTLPNLAPDAPPESVGTIIGCEWTEGRWPGKRALDFKQFGDRIRFSLAAVPASLTCMAWVRVDGLGHPFNALLMSGDGQPGEIQWQLNAAGKMIFGERKLPGWGASHVATTYSDWRAVKPTQLGLWVHLALVYDRQAGTVIHYVNGRSYGISQMKLDQPIALGSMEIGNWTPRLDDPMEPIRNFNGRMDEFALFGRALSAREIQQCYKASRPD
jgi:hypothetical protein